MNPALFAIWKRTLSEYGNNPAITDNERRLDYTQLDLFAKKIAGWLSEKGISNQCVLIISDDRLESIVCMLGVLFSGNHYFYLEKSAATQLLASYLPYLNPAATLKTSEFSTGLSIPELNISEKEQYSSDFEYRASTSEYFAIYTTSGTTGTPKMVKHSMDFMLHESLQQIELTGLTANDRRDYGGSLMFSASLGAIFPTLFAGAALHLHSIMKTDVFSLPKYWEEAKITITSVPVSVLRALANSTVSLQHLDSLRLIFITAEAASYEDMILFTSRLPHHIILSNGYATTETRAISFKIHHLDNIEKESLHTVGRPVKGKGVYIMGEYGTFLPANQSGEIIVEAQGLPDRYLNNEASSTQSFFYSSNGIRCYKTGDKGHLTPEGYVVLEGRIDDVVKINGIKVNLQDVEKVLLQHEGIREAAVVLMKSGRISAFYVTHPNETPAVSLRKSLSKKLSPLQMPAQFIPVEVLPKTLTGKIDRAALKTYVAKKDANEDLPENPSPDDLVDLISRVWKKELELSEPVDRHDDFFKDLGGNSLLATVCIHEIEKLTALSLPEGLGNTYSTPEMLASFLQDFINKPANCVQIGDFSPDRPSLYFIPPFPGDRRTYSDLETRLFKHYNLHFLYYNPIDSNGEIVPFETLTKALADQVTSTGEVHLFGFSFGGIMAYFLCLELEKRNQPVSFLELLDTPLYSKLTRSERTFNFSIRVLRKIKQFALSPIASWRKYVLNFNKAYQVYQDNFTSENQTTNQQHPSQVISRYTDSFPKYQPLDAAIILFTASERGKDYVYRQNFRWEKFTRKRLYEKKLDGWHVELLASEENLNAIASTLTGLTHDQMPQKDNATI